MFILVVTIHIIVSLVIIGLDNTILNVALPTLQDEFDASASKLQWMVDSYLLVFAGLLLVFGTHDDNVHPQNSWAFVDELVKADIPFDLMVYPMRQHGIGDRPASIHLFEKMLEFWRQRL